MQPHGSLTAALHAARSLHACFKLPPQPSWSSRWHTGAPHSCPAPQSPPGGPSGDPGQRGASTRPRPAAALPCQSSCQLAVQHAPLLGREALLQVTSRPRHGNRSARRPGAAQQQGGIPSAPPRRGAQVAARSGGVGGAPAVLHAAVQCGLAGKSACRTKPCTAAEAARAASGAAAPRVRWTKASLLEAHACLPPVKEPRPRMGCAAASVGACATRAAGTWALAASTGQPARAGTGRQAAVRRWWRAGQQWVPASKGLARG